MKRHLISIFVLSVTLFSCSSSEQEDNKRLRQFNEKIKQEDETQLHIKEVANKYSAIYVKPYSEDWSKKYTFELQDKFQNKKIIFNSKLVDISKVGNEFQLVFGNDYFSSTMFFLSSTRDVVNKIIKSKENQFLVIASIKSIRPLLNNDIDGDKITKAIENDIFGRSYIVSGKLDDFVIEKNPNKANQRGSK
jgi:hypothetical protein